MGLTLVTAPPSQYDQARRTGKPTSGPGLSKSTSKSTVDRVRDRLGPSKDTTVRDRARDAFDRMSGKSTSGKSSGNAAHDRVR